MPGVLPRSTRVTTYEETDRGRHVGPGRELATSNLRLLWIACGTSDGFISLNREFKTWLTAKGIKFTEVETEGSHFLFR